MREVGCVASRRDRKDRTSTGTTRLDGRAPSAVRRRWRARPSSALVRTGGALVAVIIAAAQLSDYWLSLSTQAGVLAVACLGLVVIMGYAGQPSLGHVAFYGLGAYLSAVGTVQWGVNAGVATASGVAACVTIALTVGWPTLRLKGPHLAVATFALGSAFFSFVATSYAFNAQLGIGNVPRLELAGWRVDSWADRHLAVWAVAIFLVFAVERIRRLRFGRSLAVIAFDEDLAASLGIRVHTAKVVAFAVSAAVGALGGSLFAHTNSYVSPQSFGFQSTILMLAILFVGGVRSTWGSLLAAALLVVVPEWLFASFLELKPTIFSVLLLGMLMVRHGGATPGLLRARIAPAIRPPVGGRRG